MDAKKQEQFIKFLKNKRCLTLFKKAYKVFEISNKNRTFTQYLAENSINNAVSSAFDWEGAEEIYKLGTFKKWSKLNADWRGLLGDNSWHSWKPDED